jgi:predicted lipid-binding transport protein (Tim44 family)
MNKLLSLCFAVLLGFGLAVPDADAKRFGGGGSIGKQRTMNAPQQSNAAPAKPAQAPGAAGAPAASGASKWLGPLAGLAAGGLLASLFMGGAFDGIKMMDILMMLALGAAIFFIFRMLRKPQPQAARPMQYAGMGEQTVAGMMNTGGAASSVPVMSATRPAWFEDEPFLREAKTHFLRLQDGYDRADLNDIREYVTPEMFAEINMQIRERGSKSNQTEVLALNAAMQDVVTEGDMVIASVHFSGTIREDGGPAEPFSEVWHIQKSQSQPNASWLIAGIQQL